MFKDSSITLGLEDVGKLINIHRWELESALLRRETRAVGDSTHFDCRFAAVKERVKHLWVVVTPGNSLLIEPVIPPHCIRCREMVFRLISGTLASADDFKTNCFGPVQLFGDKCRLVAIGHGIHNTLPLSHPGQGRTQQAVGFDIDHDHMFSHFDGIGRMQSANFRVAGDFHDNVAVGLNQLHGVVGDGYFTSPCRIVDII